MEILISMLKRLDGFDISQTAAAQHVFSLALLPLVLFAVAVSVSSLISLSLSLWLPSHKYATLLTSA